MPTTTIALGAALIVLGVASYVLTNGVSVTALIPAAFGLLLTAAGMIARNDRLRMHAMHGAVVVALLGFLGSFRGLLGIAKVLDGTAVRRGRRGNDRRRPAGPRGFEARARPRFR